VATMRTGRRPTWSDRIPSASDPKTEPMKNMDWASAGFQLSLHTQCICHNKTYTCIQSATSPCGSSCGRKAGRSVCSLQKVGIFLLHTKGTIVYRHSGEHFRSQCARGLSGAHRQNCTQSGAACYFEWPHDSKVDRHRGGSLPSQAKVLTEGGDSVSHSCV
jgi:hypothetical protein